VQSITSFALYGFPESHAASFALLAYASAYLKCHYLAAFTAALLNNQPMGFYHASTVVKDAQRHGLKIKPIDITRSDWLCTLEKNGDTLCVRLGLRYVKGLREEAAQAIVRERARRAFASIDDLMRRVSILRKAEAVMLAEIGALNSIGEGSAIPREPRGLPCPKTAGATQAPALHRRDALWQVERASRPAGPLWEELSELSFDSALPASPLAPMTREERLIADFRGTSLTVGPHPMAYRRVELKALGVRSAIELKHLRTGQQVRIGGCVIARQRPGTAKGFVFLSLEDETGIANAIITPGVFEQNRLVIVQEPFLLIEGKLQNQDNVISVKAERVRLLAITQAETSSHDFY